MRRLLARIGWVELAAALVALLVGLSLASSFTVDYLWFDALGYAGAFWTMRLAKVGLFASALAASFVYFWTNLRLLARNLTGAPTSALAAPLAGGWLSTIGAFLVALVFALGIGGAWDRWLRFHWAQSYGRSDPIFGRDLGFYLFELPFIELVQNALAVAGFLASALLVTAYMESAVLRVAWPGRISAPPAVLRHIGGNAALFLGAIAWGFYLDRYELLQSTSGVVYGAGYTDLHVMLPALLVAAVATLALAALLLRPQLLATGSRGLLALVVYLLLLLAVLGIAPWVVQSFRVAPNELGLETPFLEHNIAFTREAYGLDDIDERGHPVLGELTPQALEENADTIDNVRLWDWRPLSQTFRQLQRIRTYYEFGDVDVDRYRVDGRYRQVLLALRELADRLPAEADTWVNQRLQYTHGYGLVMTLAAEKTEAGSPQLIVKDLPPKSAGGLEAAEPALYYGEAESGYRIVNTRIAELDYPAGDDNVYTHYRGRGGILLDALWRRVLFAWHESDLGILVTDYITPESRIQLWRSVRERVSRLAPFLVLDKDPYPVLSEGRLYWIQDAYTVSSWFPYSEPYSRDFNYIRNSVKVVVDGYEGTVIFYVMDPDDPVLGVYLEALPDLFRPLASMPEGLRDHIRYPVDLFEAQAAIYSVYHMRAPQVFYNREDPWRAPREKYGGEVVRMRPYYVLMRLPGEERLEFLLMMPLTPENRDNMIAWLAARSDFPSYGELFVYKLPKERLFLGPMQVEATIDQDTLISQQLSLWDQRGSRVVRGNLLVIPIEDAFVYIEPVYLIAEDTDIPQLKRIIASDGDRLAMEPTLERALAAVYGEAPRGGAQIGPDSGRNERLAGARRALERARSALREGRWEDFGHALEALERALTD